MSRHLATPRRRLRSRKKRSQDLEKPAFAPVSRRRLSRGPHSSPGRSGLRSLSTEGRQSPPISSHPWKQSSMGEHPEGAQGSAGGSVPRSRAAGSASSNSRPKLVGSFSAKESFLFPLMRTRNGAGDVLSPPLTRPCQAPGVIFNYKFVCLFVFVETNDLAIIRMKEFLRSQLSHLFDFPSFPPAPVCTHDFRQSLLTMSFTPYHTCVFPGMITFRAV